MAVGALYEATLGERVKAASAERVHHDDDLDAVAETGIDSNGTRRPANSPANGPAKSTSLGSCRSEESPIPRKGKGDGALDLEPHDVVRPDGGPDEGARHPSAGGELAHGAGLRMDSARFWSRAPPSGSCRVCTTRPRLAQLVPRRRPASFTAAWVMGD